MKLVEISDFYAKPVSEDWQELPLPKEIFGDTVSYISKDGVQLVTSLKNYNGLKIIHVTVVVIPALGGKEEGFEEKIPDIISYFFDDRKFARQPDSDNPLARHYFSEI